MKYKIGQKFFDSEGKINVITVAIDDEQFETVYFTKPLNHSSTYYESDLDSMRFIEEDSK